MSFDRQIDQSFDKAGDALEKGTASFFIGVGKGTRNLYYQSELRKKAAFTFPIFLGISAFLEYYGRQKAWTQLIILEKLYEMPYFFFPVGTLVMVTLTLFTLYLYGSASNKVNDQFQVAFERVGLYSKRMLVGENNKPRKEFPFLIKAKPQKDKGTVYLFRNVGLPMKQWQEASESIQATLGQKITSLGPTNDSAAMIELKLGGSVVPDSVPWTHELISGLKLSQVAIGVDKDGKRIVQDFQKVPHMLISGLTGSGKSVELRAIAYQTMEQQGANVWTVDFKGGIEFEPFEPLGVRCVWERNDTLKIIEYLLEEHHARIKLFKSKGAKNIDEYNEKSQDKIKRCYLVIDELAELTDPTGVPKDQKEIFALVEGGLSSIARLCRASGIHLLLATQRPDAKVITGQIKTNIGARVTGYMPDNGASMTALGSTAATKLLNTGGRFLFSTGNEVTEFQAPYFQDKNINKKLKVDYTKGMLVSFADFENNYSETPSVSEKRIRQV